MNLGRTLEFHSVQNFNLNILFRDIYAFLFQDAIREQRFLIRRTTDITANTHAGDIPALLARPKVVVLDLEQLAMCTSNGGSDSLGEAANPLYLFGGNDGNCGAHCSK